MLDIVAHLPYGHNRGLLSVAARDVEGLEGIHMLGLLTDGNQRQEPYVFVRLRRKRLRENLGVCNWMGEDSYRS